MNKKIFMVMLLCIMNLNNKKLNAEPSKYNLLLIHSFLTYNSANFCYNYWNVNANFNKRNYNSLTSLVHGCATVKHLNIVLNILNKKYKKEKKSKKDDNSNNEITVISRFFKTILTGVALDNLFSKNIDLISGFNHYDLNAYLNILREDVSLLSGFNLLYPSAREFISNCLSNV